MNKLFGMFFVFLSLLVAAPCAMATTAEPARVVAADVAKVNVNTATAKDLQTLPGIGKVTAERIVAYRTEKGKFRSSADLLKVKGVGEKSLEKIRALITIE